MLTACRPFEEDWWLWLTLTGVSIGCVASIKWVGLFVTCVVGLYTAEDLWNKLGDINMPYVRCALRCSDRADQSQRVYVKHWIARILCLIVIPFCVYALCFKIHFMILNRSGTGDSQMSSLFQAHLEGNDFARNPLGTSRSMDAELTGPEPTYGSKLTFKNMGYGGGLLHSHVQVYPVGSQQQQVTCYHYKDNNNEWLIVPTWEDEPLDPEGELRYLKDGDVMRIVHESTGRNLHSHSVAAPVTKLNHEVSAYGNATVGDSNDYWVIEVVDDFLRGSKTSFERIHSLSTRLRLRHMNSNCYLRAANAILPQWGFKQVEVSCDKENRPKDEFTYWNIESHWNDRCTFSDRRYSTDDRSAGRRPKAVSLTLPARLLASQRRHAHVEQRARARHGQGGLDRVQAVRLAVPVQRDAHERLARHGHQVLPRRQCDGLVEQQCRVDRLDRDALVELGATEAKVQRLRSWCVPPASTVLS